MDKKAYIAKLVKLFSAHADPRVAKGAGAYMRNQFVYFGLSTPQRRMLTKQFLVENGHPGEQAQAIVRMLWKMPQRELQYFAMEILEKQAGKMKEKDLALLEYMITHRSWWDTVDFIAPKLVGPLFKTHPHLIIPCTSAWMRSGNTWLMRSALLFQMKYRKQTDEALLFSLIRSCMHEKEFFIRKAIGWTLREYSKTDPAAVKRFVRENAKALSPLSYKEALKRLG